MKPISVHRLIFMALMAAMVCALTFFRFPLLGSKVHLANAMCLLSGLLLGGVSGGLAAGIGSGLYDALWGGYDIIQCLITALSKFLMAYICARVAGSRERGGPHRLRVILGCALGALVYVALYMLKTFIYQQFIYGFPADAVALTMLAKLPASLINAVFAMLTTPVFFFSIRPILSRHGLTDKL